MRLEELIEKLPVAEQEALLAQVADYRDALEREKCQKSFMSYVKRMWPGFVHGRHHALMAKKMRKVWGEKVDLEGKMSPAQREVFLLVVS